MLGLEIACLRRGAVLRTGQGEPMVRLGEDGCKEESLSSLVVA